jgi:hypothetical protein
MPSTSLTDADKKLVNRYLDLAAQFKKLYAPKHLLVTCTHRSPEEQMEAFKQGRGFHDDKWVVEDYTKTITDLSGEPGHESLHNLTPCRALDVAVCVAGKVTWDYREYLPIGPLAEKSGLEWGGNWVHRKDFPHLQLPQETT